MTRMVIKKLKTSIMTMLHRLQAFTMFDSTRKVYASSVSAAAARLGHLTANGPTRFDSESFREAFRRGTHKELDAFPFCANGQVRKGVLSRLRSTSDMR